MEIAIIKFFNQLWRGTFVDAVTDWGSYIPFLGLAVAVIAVIVLVFDKRNGRTVFLALVLALIINFAITDGVFKNILVNFDFLPFRDRPYVSLPGDVVIIGRQFVDASFPSGHMTAVLTVSTVLVYYYRRWWWLASLFVVFMAFARMHLGVHYPTDVLAGIILGIFYGALSIWGVRFVETLRYKKANKK